MFRTRPPILNWSPSTLLADTWSIYKILSKVLNLQSVCHAHTNTCSRRCVDPKRRRCQTCVDPKICLCQSSHFYNCRYDTSTLRVMLSFNFKCLVNFESWSYFFVCFRIVGYLLIRNTLNYRLKTIPKWYCVIFITLFC